MYKISKRFNVPLQLLIRANPHIPNPKIIFPGQLIYIPIPKKHRDYPKAPKCMVPYLPQVLQMYYKSMMMNVPPMMTGPGVYGPQAGLGPYANQPYANQPYANQSYDAYYDYDSVSDSSSD
ncbi:MAG: LysM peptidoglycan-binding domain-containing protein [Bacillaceae bacterium]|nr:LysM peptidoglycan-binding domain-containing protein [Bacillaceae bacterium]